MKKFAILSVVLASVLAISACGNSKTQKASDAADVLNKYFPMEVSENVTLVEADNDHDTVEVQATVHVHSNDVTDSAVDKFLARAQQDLKQNYCGDGWASAVHDIELPLDIMLETRDGESIGMVLAKPDLC